VIAVLLAPLAMGAAALQPPVFRAAIETVYVDAFVTSHGTPVADLGPSDFLLKDNGVTQDVRLVDAQAVGTLAILAFDTSMSVAGDKLLHLRAAGQAAVAGLGERDRAAVVAFSSATTLLQPPTADAQLLSSALDGLASGGGTSLLDAIFTCLKRPWGRERPLLLVFTDGEDTTSWLDTVDVMEAARTSSVLVHVVGVEDSRLGVETPEPLDRRGEPLMAPVPEKAHPSQFLRRLAEITGGTYWKAESFGRLKDVFAAIMRGMHSRYVLGYVPTGVVRTGTHRITLTVKTKGADVRIRREYVVPK
jgi:Ca-activated chloride channel homolog